MCYSIEPSDRIYGYLSFAKNIDKNLSNKYSQKLFDTAKKSTTDAIKTASKRAIQKTAEETGDLISNKIANKMTSISKNYHRIIYRRHRNIKRKINVSRKKIGNY